MLIRQTVRVDTGEVIETEHVTCESKIEAHLRVALEEEHRISDLGIWYTNHPAPAIAWLLTFVD